MKKRIRKKLHVGEFRHYGNIIFINTLGDVETAEEILNKFEPLIDKFSLTLAGGGTCRIIIPPRKNNKYIPELAAEIVLAVALETIPLNRMMFCVYVKGVSEVPQEALDAIKVAFADEKYGVQIDKRIDLWHGNLGLV